MKHPAILGTLTEVGMIALGAVTGVDEVLIIFAAVTLAIFVAYKIEKT
jgi:hypothetical protein